MHLKLTMGKKLGCFKHLPTHWTAKEYKHFLFIVYRISGVACQLLSEAQCPSNRCSVYRIYLVSNVARFYETKKFLFTNCPEAFLCPKWLRLSFRPVLILNDQVRKSFLLRRNWPKSRRNLQTYKPNSYSLFSHF